MTRAARRATAALALVAGAAGADDLTILQWFEQPWVWMERQAPVFFEAGYDGVWTPPPTKGRSDNTVGYDVFDRFDLGSPEAPTAYGTEDGLLAAFRELQRSGGRVFPDAILNHNSGRDASGGFQTAGGWPGFTMGPIDTGFFGGKFPDGDWGDFHNGYNANGIRGYYQSENPGGAFYDLERGDLVALVDINQASNNFFVRHPISEGDPRNIPAGTVHNRPDPENRRFYPDRQLTPLTFQNQGQSFTIYPFNVDRPEQGVPVSENATGLLMRWTQWMLEVVGVDGFRLDASKHAPTWFWDTYFDAATYQRWTRPDGTKATPYTFGENIASNSFVLTNQFRRDGFADRDALDIQGSARLRDMVGAAGLGTWDWVFDTEAHLDYADNRLHDGSAGVFHNFSHDNGTVGDGGSQPPLPTLRQQGFFTTAYVLLRRGPAIVYHNARGVTRPGGFWVREGTSLALGWDPAAGREDDRILRLLEIRRNYGRGTMQFLNATDPVNASLADVLVFERRSPGGQGNLLVGINDRYDAGFDQRSVQTGFAPGTRLVELTGNAANPAVDPAGQIPEVLVVDSSRRVLISVPRNASTSGEHHLGYVAYGPAVPVVDVVLGGVSATIPADPETTTPNRRRSVDVPVIGEDSFTITVTTTRADPQDPNADVAAYFRINQGFIDVNGNGIVDIRTADPEPDQLDGWERFTFNRSLTLQPGLPNGLYTVTVDATALPEGFNYLTVRVLRNRPEGGDPLWTERRIPFFLDREAAPVDVSGIPDEIDTTSLEITADVGDRTGERVFMVRDLPEGVTDLAPYTTLFTQAVQLDRFTWRKTLSGFDHGPATVDVIVREPSGRLGVRSKTIFVALCDADLNRDGVADVFDILAFFAAFGTGGGDWNGDGSEDIFDILGFFASFGSADC